MQVPDQSKQSRESLTAKIEELETLLNRRKKAAENVPVLNEMAVDDQFGDSQIPILDELVSFEAEPNSMSGQQHVELPDDTSGQLMDLIDNIENKLTEELETIVRTFKSSMKESIIGELKHRIEDTSTYSDNQPGHTVESGDKPDY